MLTAIHPLTLHSCAHICVSTAFIDKQSGSNQGTEQALEETNAGSSTHDGSTNGIQRWTYG